MPQYNPNDFYPSVDTKVVSDGNVVYQENVQVPLLPNTTNTASFYSPVMTNYIYRGMVITINVTALSGTSPTLNLVVCDGNGFGITPTSTAITATGTYKYYLYPTNFSSLGTNIGLSSQALIRNWQAHFLIGGTTPSFTLSATVDYIL